MKDRMDTDTRTDADKEIARESRRNFLLSSGRYAAVAAITYSMGEFIVRAMDEECVNNSICDACLAVKNCGLPLGLEFKDGTLQDIDQSAGGAHEHNTIETDKKKEPDHV